VIFSEEMVGRRKRVRRGLKGDKVVKIVDWL